MQLMSLNYLKNSCLVYDDGKQLMLVLIPILIIYNLLPFYFSQPYPSFSFVLYKVMKLLAFQYVIFKDHCAIKKNDINQLINNSRFIHKYYNIF